MKKLHFFYVGDWHETSTLLRGLNYKTTMTAPRNFGHDDDVSDRNPLSILNHQTTMMHLEVLMTQVSCSKKMLVGVSWSIQVCNKV
jgi:hypothetical protein